MSGRDRHRNTILVTKRNLHQQFCKLPMVGCYDVVRVNMFTEVNQAKLALLCVVPAL